MKIAIVGSGISGMSAGHFLTQAGHQVTLFEASHRLGGHTATVAVESAQGPLAVDTGFIVFNDWTYPSFIALMNELGVASQPAPMSFSVSDRQSGLEYAGSNLNSLFAQRRNLLSPYFLGMVRDILRFNREAPRDLQEKPELGEMSLDDYLQRFGYGKAFRDHYLMPMGAAIWSATQETMEAFPLVFFLRFFRNHGLLNLRNRPQWRVIQGGSKAYIDPLIAAYRERVRLNTPVLGLRRGASGVTIRTAQGEEAFDQVVLACHSDQALALLSDPSPEETQILGAIPYQENEVVLHTDSSLLPRSRRCWSSWNVSLLHDGQHLPRLTYNMNILQSLSTDQVYCVTLNQSEDIAPEKIIGSYHFDHPVFNQAGMRAQQRWSEINGSRHTWFCGAYWRNGFHEDGVWSARRVADGMRQDGQ